MYIENTFLRKKQLLLFVQSDTASQFCLRTCLFKTFLSRPMSRVIGFKEVFCKIRVILKKTKTLFLPTVPQLLRNGDVGSYCCLMKSILWQRVLLMVLWSLPWVRVLRILCITDFRVDWQQSFLVSKAIIGIFKDLLLSLSIMAIQFLCF